MSKPFHVPSSFHFLHKASFPFDSKETEAQKSSVTGPGIIVGPQSGVKRRESGPRVWELNHRFWPGLRERGRALDRKFLVMAHSIYYRVGHKVGRCSVMSLQSVNKRPCMVSTVSSATPWLSRARAPRHYHRRHHWKRKHG